MTSGDYWSADWQSACDPVPARRELTDAEKKRLEALFEMRRRQGFRRRADATSPYRIDADFDEMGA